MNLFKNGVKMAVKMIFVMLLSFFLYFSINVIISAITNHAGRTACLIIGQIFALILVIVFAGTPLYTQGMTYKNLVKIGREKKDVLKGLKIGLIGNFPFFVLFIIYAVMTVTENTSFRTAWYTLLNSHYFALYSWIAGNAEVTSELHAWQLCLYLVIQFLAPVISAIAFLLGFQDKLHLGKLIHDTTHNMIYKKEEDKK